MEPQGLRQPTALRKARYLRRIAGRLSFTCIFSGLSVDDVAARVHSCKLLLHSTGHISLERPLAFSNYQLRFGDKQETAKTLPDSAARRGNSSGP